MKTKNEKLHTLLANLDRDSNLEYINAIAEQMEDNQAHLRSVSKRANDPSSLNLFKHEFDRLSGRNEVLLNMIFKLLQESKEIQEKSVSITFELLKENAE